VSLVGESSRGHFSMIAKMQKRIFIVHTCSYTWPTWWHATLL